MKLATLLSATTVLTAALVSTAPAPELQKRGIEVVYLSNCQTVGSGTSRWDLEMEYYADTNQSQNGEFPGEANRAVVPYTSTSTAPASWYNDREANFSSGVTFKSTLWALDGAVGTQVGTGYNGYHGFGCYKDNGRKLYGTESRTGNTVHWYRNCYAQYYCMY